MPSSLSRSPPVPPLQSRYRTATRSRQGSFFFKVVGRAMSSLKRKRAPLAGARRELTGDEQAVFDVIQSRGNMGILKPELKREVKNIKDRDFAKCVKSLIEKQKIKEVKSVQNKKPYLMATEFEASVVLTGGSWYSDGSLDTAFVDNLMNGCLTLIRKVKVATVEQLCELVNKSQAFNVVISAEQIKEIVKALVLDSEIMEVKSTGSGIYNNIPIGKVCYKIGKAEVTVTPAMVSMPCGSCPRINQCTPNGAISPITCEYYNKWLNF